jgi:serine/threonine-protein kinase
MGTLYLARTEGAAGFRKPVVVKLLHPHLMEEQKAVEAFIKEAKLAAQLVHPNIVQILDFGEQEGQYVMVLEYVHGYDGSLLARHMVETGRLLSINEALFAVYQMLRGLEYAHALRDQTTGDQLRLVHCDISPHNLLLSAEGQVKLADFGIARMVSEKSRSSRSDTDSDGIAGKLIYLAPEQVSGGKVDHRTDLYAAGLVLYELLSGQRPFEAETEAQILLRVAQGQVMDIREFRPEVNAGVARVLAQALAPNKVDRYQNAADFLTDVRREMVGTTPDEMEPSFARSMDARFREPSWTSLGGALPDIARELAGPALGLALLGHGGATFRLEREGPERRKGLNPFVVVFAALLAGLIGFAILTLSQREVEQSSSESLAVVIDRRQDRPPVTANGIETGPSRADGDGVPVPAAPPDGRQPLTGDEVTQRLLRHRAALFACFQRYPLPGREALALIFEIRGSGEVQEVSVEPDWHHNTELGRCLTRVARRSSFRPHPAESAMFRVPLTLQGS